MKSIITKIHQEASTEALARLINHESVATSDGTTNPPFGQGIALCLKEALQICKELGMTTYEDPAGFYGFADYGVGAELVAVVCHLDVVPAGDVTLWKTDPFVATIKEGVMYGRGSQDDKGPTIASLFGFKAVVDAGYQFNKRIRFIFSTDEETLWRCMAAYNKKEEQPTMGFVPDGSFPLVFAEKGLLQVELIGPGSSDIQLQAGDALNVVPAKACYHGSELTAVMKKLTQLGIEFDLTETEVTVKGKAVHASVAQLGENAINLLAMGLAPAVPHPALTFLAEQIGKQTNGATLFGEISDDVSGELTFNVGLLNVSDESSTIGIDMRLPVKSDKEALMKQLAKVAESYGLTLKEFDYVPAIYVPKESPLIQTLLKVYREKTGDLTEPMTSGGATLARTMDNLVAFGAHFPESKSLAHQANEGQVLSEMYQAMDIYASAIIELACEK